MSLISLGYNPRLLDLPGGAVSPEAYRRVQVAARPPVRVAVPDVRRLTGWELAQDEPAAAPPPGPQQQAAPAPAPAAERPPKEVTPALPTPAPAAAADAAPDADAALRKRFGVLTREEMLAPGRTDSLGRTGGTYTELPGGGGYVEHDPSNRAAMNYLAARGGVGDRAAAYQLFLQANPFSFRGGPMNERDEKASMTAFAGLMGLGAQSDENSSRERVAGIQADAQRDTAKIQAKSAGEADKVRARLLKQQDFMKWQADRDAAGLTTTADDIERYHQAVNSAAQFAADDRVARMTGQAPPVGVAAQPPVGVAPGSGDLNSTTQAARQILPAREFSDFKAAVEADAQKTGATFLDSAMGLLPSNPRILENPQALRDFAAIALKRSGVSKDELTSDLGHALIRDANATVPGFEDGSARREAAVGGLTVRKAPERDGGYHLVMPGGEATYYPPGLPILAGKNATSELIGPLTSDGLARRRRQAEIRSRILEALQSVQP